MSTDKTQVKTYRFMKEIKKLLRLSGSEYYEAHLSIINPLLPTQLTPMEVKVLACFMSLTGDISKYRFGPSAKKIVMKELGLSPAGISNYLKFLVEKEALIKQGDILSILPILVPEDDEQIYMIKLQNPTHGTRARQVN